MKYQKITKFSKNWQQIKSEKITNETYKKYLKKDIYLQNEYRNY